MYIHKKYRSVFLSARTIQMFKDIRIIWTNLSLYVSLVTISALPEKRNFQG